MFTGRGTESFNLTSLLTVHTFTCASHRRQRSKGSQMDFAEVKIMQLDKGKALIYATKTYSFEQHLKGY